MPKKGERAAPATDLVGKQFGYLKVLEFSHRDENSKQYWKCHCDLCGSDKLISRNYLIRKIKYIKACGCMQGRNVMLYQNNVFNQYDLSNTEYAIGYTSKGAKFYFDHEDYELIKKYTWHMSSQGYIRTTDYSTDKNNPKRISMHRLIMGINGMSSKIAVDHINHNKADNRKTNLRIVTNSQNQMNCSPRKHSSPCTGVSWHKVRQKWIAQIQINKKLKYLGIYDNLEDAIRARKKAEQKYFKEYAYNLV